jgi:hypothetical protein
LSKLEVQAEVRGNLIIITEPATLFYAIYSKPDDQPQLILRGEHRLTIASCLLSHGKCESTGDGVDCVTACPDKADDGERATPPMPLDALAEARGDL